MRFIRLLIIVVAAFAARPAASQTTYDGMWWDTSKQGMGVSITHQGSQLFLAAFVYGTNGQPVWYVGYFTLNGTSATGNLLFATGDPLSDNYNQNDARTQTAGTATLTFASATSGRMTYTIGNVSGSLNLTRFNTGTAAATGVYLGGENVYSSTCGEQSFPAAIQVAQDPSQLGMRIIAIGSILTCTGIGPYHQVGNRLIWSATLACNDGTSQTVSNMVLSTMDSAIAGRGTVTTANGCTSDVTIGGVR